MGINAAAEAAERERTSRAELENERSRFAELQREEAQRTAQRAAEMEARFKQARAPA